MAVAQANHLRKQEPPYLAPSRSAGGLRSHSTEQGVLSRHGSPRAIKILPDAWGWSFAAAWRDRGHVSGPLGWQPYQAETASVPPAVPTAALSTSTRVAARNSSRSAALTRSTGRLSTGARSVAWSRWPARCCLKAPKCRLRYAPPRGQNRIRAHGNGGTPLLVIWLFLQRSRLPGPMLGTGWLSASLGGMPCQTSTPTRLTTHAGSGPGSPGGALCLIPWRGVGRGPGKRTLVAASSPEKLTEQVEAAVRGEAGPDEGAKTQAWRALHKHKRG